MLSEGQEFPRFDCNRSSLIGPCLQIEAPYMPPPELEVEEVEYSVQLLPGYNGIGEFYRELQHGKPFVRLTLS